MTPSQVVELAILGSVFGLVLAVWLIGVLAWSLYSSSRSRQVQSRLGLHEGQPTEARVLSLWKDGTEVTTTVATRKRQPMLAFIERKRQAAGIEIPAQAIVMAMIGGGLLLFALAAVLVGMLVALGVCVIATFLVWVYVNNRVGRRLIKFESQLVDALELTARSLKAGHTLVGAFRLVAEELPAPVSTTFSEICQLQSLGLTLEEALERISKNSGSGDMQLFATSVIIQLRTGGNLADMMNRLAYVIRDRMRLKRRVRVLTAQTQMSKRVLMILPFALFVVLNIINPHYMTLLYTEPAGRIMIMIAMTGLGLGFWAMNRLSVLHY